MTTTIHSTYATDRTSASMDRARARLAGWASLAGALTMIVGALLYFSSGTDLWLAIDGGEMAAYLPAAAAVKPQLVASLCFWIAGVLILGIAWQLIIPFCRHRPEWARLAEVCANTAVPLAIVAMLTMMAVVVQIAPASSAEDQALANVIGWLGIRFDDLATALLIGLTPAFVALAGRGGWLPIWLERWGYLAGLVGLFSLLVLFIPGLGQAGFVIVPVGIGWMLAAGLVLLRWSNKGVA